MEEKRARGNPNLGKKWGNQGTRETRGCDLRADNDISRSVAIILMLFQSIRSIIIAIMSVTTTSTTTGSLSILADYEVHHSGIDQNGNEPATAVNPSQPAHWPTHHRRMPAYRPVNRDLSYTQRPAGNGHPAEYAFIQIMLHGCWINAVRSYSSCFFLLSLAFDSVR